MKRGERMGRLAWGGRQAQQFVTFAEIDGRLTNEDLTADDWVKG